MPAYRRASPSEKPITDQPHKTQPETLLAQESRRRTTVVLVVVVLVCSCADGHYRGSSTTVHCSLVAVFAVDVVFVVLSLVHCAAHQRSYR